jgi:AraC family transcriptional regulator
MYEISHRRHTTLPGIEVLLSDLHFSDRHVGVEISEFHILSLCSRPPLFARGRYLEVENDFSQLGDMLFMPARTPMMAARDDGLSTNLCCLVTESRFETLVGQRPQWTKENLRTSLNLQSSNLRQGLERIFDEVVNPGFASKVTIESLTTVLLVDLMRAFGSDPAADRGSMYRGGLAPFQLRRIEERIVDGKCDLPTVGELAAELGISSRHLLRGYRLTTGSTLRTRIQLASRDRATALLARTNMPLKAIAYKLGFRSQGSFSTAFRNATGESPSEFRHRHQ